MDKEMRGAFIAWRLAIEAKMVGTLGDVRELAEQFGKDITTTECLDAVGEFFNWTKIAKSIKLH